MRRRKICPKHPDLTDKWNKEGKCKECQREWRRASDARNRERRRKTQKAWRDRNIEANRAKERAYWAHNRDKQRNANLRKRCFTLALFNERLEAQAHRCAICGDPLSEKLPRDIHADHDHASRTPRDILCGGCNVGLGAFREDSNRLRAAIQYLAKWGKE